VDSSETFDPSVIADELDHARRAGRAMLDPRMKQLFVNGLYEDDLTFLHFVERCQAFHVGAIDLIERGNPLGAMTLLRSYVENIASVYWLTKRPEDIDKLRPNAKQRLPMGQVIGHANKTLPGLKAVYAHLSDAAHPSGAGGYQTLRVEEDGLFTWQSFPTFNTVADALQLLQWAEQLCEVSARIITETVESRIRVDEQADRG
jgi:hypothetical protein